jgi:hypothetical protein
MMRRRNSSRGRRTPLGAAHLLLYINPSLSSM